MLIAGAGGAIGLLLGGVLTSYASWRWNLLVNVPIGVVTIAGAALLLHHSRLPLVRRSTSRVSLP